VISAGSSDGLLEAATRWSIIGAAGIRTDRHVEADEGDGADDEDQRDSLDQPVELPVRHRGQGRDPDHGSFHLLTDAATHGEPFCSNVRIARAWMASAVG
jgi:hypothetical protein